MFGISKRFFIIAATLGFFPIVSLYFRKEKKKSIKKIFDLLGLHYSKTFSDRGHIAYHISKDKKRLEKYCFLMKDAMKGYKKFPEIKSDIEQGKLMGIPPCCIKKFVYNLCIN